MNTRSGRTTGAPARTGRPVVAGAGGRSAPSPAASRWDSANVSAAASRALRASAALAARGREDEGSGPARHATPALPADAWALILERAPSCRCVLRSNVYEAGAVMTLL